MVKYKLHTCWAGLVFFASLSSTRPASSPRRYMATSGWRPSTSRRNDGRSCFILLEKNYGTCMYHIHLNSCPDLMLYSGRNFLYEGRNRRRRTLTCSTSGYEWRTWWLIVLPTPSKRPETSSTSFLVRIVIPSSAGRSLDYQEKPELLRLRLNAHVHLKSNPHPQGRISPIVA